MKYLFLIIMCLMVSMTLKGQVQLFKLPTLNGQMKVLVVPLGQVEAHDITVVKKAIEEYHRAEVTVSEPLTIPSGIGTEGSSKSIRIKDGKKTIVKDSSNLDIVKLVNVLFEYKADKFNQVMGLTAYGINSGEGNWAIRGITFNLPGDTCSFVSTYLVKQQSTSKQQYEFRLAKVALHELAHSLGLPHCGTDPNGTVATGDYSDKISIIKTGDPTCFMLESTPDGEQIYQTSNKLCNPCKALIKSSTKN